MLLLFAAMLAMPSGPVGADPSSVGAKSQRPIDRSGHADPDANQKRASSARPVGSPGDWVSSDDYPHAALRANASGATVFRLTIDTSGHVADCQIVASSGNADLDATTCTVLTRRAIFTPARDGKGHAISSTYASRLNRRIPQAAPGDVAEGHPSCQKALPGDIRIEGIPNCP